MSWEVQGLSKRMAARTRLFKVRQGGASQCMCGRQVPRDLTKSRAVNLQEYKELSRSKENTGILLVPDEANIYSWRALLQVGNRGRRWRRS